MNTAAPTGTRARTRRAILDAAVSVLARNIAASLADIAAAAGVGRTTIHRYFPERSDLLAALGTHVMEQVRQATERARLDDGTAAEALERLCQEYFEIGDGLLLTFDNPDVANWADWEDDPETDQSMTRLVERGHADGTIDPHMPAQWVMGLLWALLYAAWHHVREDGATRHGAVDLCLRTLRRSIRPGD
ncbi:TetR/AcrR family transcriptional regulator [Marinactinospora rubrisoli]|uniref:TetR/AcrR family transcriptional regulator n=1 Tax=Marinactinospora rubrisoli TaxID=2715399 RepID=A0ABW2KC87_9ACTN